VAAARQRALGEHPGPASIVLPEQTRLEAALRESPDGARARRSLEKAIGQRVFRDQACRPTDRLGRRVVAARFRVEARSGGARAETTEVELMNGPAMAPELLECVRGRLREVFLVDAPGFESVRSLLPDDMTISIAL
jgi:hypothetical protein